MTLKMSQVCDCLQPKWDHGRCLQCAKWASPMVPPQGYRYKLTEANARLLYLCLIILANATGFVALASAFGTPGMELVRWSLLVSALAGAGSGLVNWWLHRGQK